jgi:hypothetical protein
MFTAEQLRMIVEVEQSMDAGEQPFVRCAGEGGRYAFPAEVLTALKVESGSTVSHETLIAIMRFNLRVLEDRIAYERGQELVAEFERDRR